MLVCIYLTIYTIYAGYIPGAEGLSAVADFVTKLKERNPKAIYLLDRTCSYSAYDIVLMLCSGHG